MRHELPNLRGVFSEPDETPDAPPFGTGFVIVCTLFAFGIFVCVAHCLFP
jgi:hypothetical protein